MNIATKILLASALCGAAAAQADEHAIRQSNQISVIEYRPGQYCFFTVTVRSWSDTITFASSSLNRTMSARDWQRSIYVYDHVVQSNGNISLRFGMMGDAGWNGGTVELKSGGVRIDADRLRQL